MSKLVRVFIIVDMEGHVAKKKKKKKFQEKGTVCYVWESNSWAKKPEEEKQEWLSSQWLAFFTVSKKKMIQINQE